MTAFFLYTFFVGFGLTLASAVLGSFETSGDHSGAGADHGHGGSVGPEKPHSFSHAGDVSPVNFQTVVAFLMGFGGVGYLVARFGLPGVILAIPMAAAGGLGTSWLILKWFRFLKRGETPLPPTSYVGLVGRLTVGIREGGTGELVYSMHGSRMVTAARSHDGVPIPRGEDVVVLRYEKGVAYVQRWSEFKEQEHL